jgi:hypothetical protein
MATLGDPPVWARSLGFSDYFGIRHRRFRDQLTDMLADPASEADRDFAGTPIDCNPLPAKLGLRPLCWRCPSPALLGR